MENRDMFLTVILSSLFFYRCACLSWWNLAESESVVIYVKRSLELSLTDALFVLVYIYSGHPRCLVLIPVHEFLRV